MDTYSQFAQKASSEKITLAVLEASKRLVAWTLHSGSIYKKENQNFAVIKSLKYGATELTQVYSLASVVAGTYYNDRDNQTIYLRLSDSSSPASKFIFITFKLYFSNVPVSAPNDLSTGFQVPFEPTINKTSQFGSEIDTVNQVSEAIEGSGSLSLFNDGVFWPENFDKLFFENQNCTIYSWHRDLPISQAKLLFKGKVESKSYSSKLISFQLKDAVNVLRDAIPLTDIETLFPTYRPLPSTYKAKKRMVFGRQRGFRPVNIDCVVDSRYPLTGTIGVTGGSTTVTGSGTAFYNELSPDDRIDINDVIYTVATINSDTSLSLTENFVGSTASGISCDFLPEHRKRFINRQWLLAGHALCQPQKTTLAGSTTTILNLSNTRDLYDGDYIYVGTLGSGQLVQINSVVNDSLVTLSTSLVAYPAYGTTVLKPCVQNLRIDDTQLLFYRDFTIDATNGILTLRDDAEINAAETRQITSDLNLTWTNGSRLVTRAAGASVLFNTRLYPGYVIKPTTSSSWYEISSIPSEELIVLKTAFSGSSTSSLIDYKSLIFNPSENILSCELMGRKDSDGYLIETGPDIVKTLLTDAGLSADLNVSSFTDSVNYAPEKLAFSIPSKFDGKVSTTYRDAINNVNRSIFGILHQDNSYLIGYDILRPSVPSTLARLEESDILDFNLTSTNKNMVKSVKVQYSNLEYDYETKDLNYSEATSTSDISQYILNTAKEKSILSLLTNANDAQRLADRWSFLLEFSTNSMVFTTKLQTSELEIGDIVDVNHRKIYERFGGTSKRKIMLIERIKKSGTHIEIEAVDLSNAFNRVAMISTETATWTNASEDIRIYTGYITDSEGLIDNNETSFYTNLVW